MFVNREQIDWNFIQEKYDSGFTYKDITREFGINTNLIIKAVKNGWLKTRTTSEALVLSLKTKPRKPISEETRKKISDSMTKYYQKNPDKIPYRIYHSTKRSIPELIFEKALKDNNFTFEAEYPAGIYQYDFALVNEKIDIEIDGDTHKKEKVLKKDKRRDEWSIERGWRVLRISASDVIKNVNFCINKLLEIIKFPLLEIKMVNAQKSSFCACGAKKYKKSINCKKCAPKKRKFDPTKEELEKLVWEMPTLKVALLYNVCDKAIEKRCKKFGIKKPPRGYWAKLKKQERDKINV